MKLFARSQNVPQQDLDSLILAAEIEEEQYQDARGEFIETGPSSSTGPSEPVIVTKTKSKGADTSKKDSTTRGSSQKGTSNGQSGTNGKKVNTKPDLVPQQKLAKGTRIPKHGETNKSTKPGPDKITAAKIKIAPPSKKSRTSDCEETLRSGRDMAAEFAFAAHGPKDNTAKVTTVPRDPENITASEAEEGSDIEDNQSWATVCLQFISST